MSGLADKLTPEQVRVGLAKLREKLDEVPAEGRGFAEAALRGLEANPDKISTAGLQLLARTLSWSAAFGGDPPPAPVGRAAGLAAMRGATDHLVEQRDAELAAARELRDTLLAAGKEVLVAAIPLVLSLAL